MQYLFVPRVIAGIDHAAASSSILGDALGIGGGYLVGVKLMGANPVVYQQNTFQFLQMNDIWSGLIKAAFFGLILTLTGCVRGYYTSGGAEGVGPRDDRGGGERVADHSVDRFFPDEAPVLTWQNDTPMISLQHVDKTLGGRKVLDDMSIDVERGESLVIVGGSGVGKSVTLKHIIGLMKPDSRPRRHRRRGHRLRCDRWS